VKIVRRALVALLSVVFKSTDFIFPKNNRLVVFSLRFSRYGDNSRALYEYLTKEGRFNAIWLSENTESYNFIKSIFPEGRVVLRYSVSGLLVALNARFYIVSYSTLDNGYFSSFSKRTYTIMLWHAVMLKKYGVLDKKLSSSIVKTFLKKETSRYKMIVASSNIDRYSTVACQGVDSRKVIITGLPRNDNLINHAFESEIDVTIPRSILQKKIILYAPTFRDCGVTEFFPFQDFDTDKLVNSLKENDVYLLIRPHQNDFKNQEKIKNLAGIGSGRILLAGNMEVPDVNSLMPYVDIVITDYSSIYIDLLLNDIPSIFIPYDLQLYKKERGLLYDYDFVTPGPKVFSQKDLINAIVSIVNGSLEYKDRMNTVKFFFHKYSDGQACRRVSDNMEIMLNE
jgi:CDP-glycerol glycerophosphotransferase (TagB/SpsB family)